MGKDLNNDDDYYYYLIADASHRWQKIWNLSSVCTAWV